MEFLMKFLVGMKFHDFLPSPNCKCGCIEPNWRMKRLLNGVGKPMHEFKARHPPKALT